MMKTRLAAATALGLTLVLLLAGGGTAGAASYTITVDASKQTAGNPHFWSATVGTGTASLTLRADLQTHYKLANRELGMQRVRGHGLLNDDMGIYKAPGSYSWTKFDKYLDAIAAAGMRPSIELSFMPTALALNGSSRDTAKDMDAYRQLIQAVVQHCVDRFGAGDVAQWYWEVWNEPDYAGFWNGTNASEAVTAKMTDYYALYDAAAAGATAALPSIQIGGPVTTEPSKIGAFLQHCKSAGSRVTFASSHAYPGGAGTSASASFGYNDNSTRTSQITGAGFTLSQIQSLNTEWNSAYTGQGGNTAANNVSMDSHANAPFILKTVKLISDHDTGDTAPLSAFSYWVISDVFGEYSGDAGSYIQSKGGGTLPFGQVFGLMTYQGVRKAAFNAFKMLNYLGPRRLMSTGGTGSDGVDGLATLSAGNDEIQVLVYNYYATIDTTGSDSVTVTLNNLPFSGKQVYLTEFGVDSSHSNPYGVWVSQGSPTNPSETQWQAMRQAQHLALLQPVSTLTAGSAYTTTLTLPRQGAALIILGVNRPVTGRNGLATIEGEDYDGQSGVTREDSNDVDLGQSIAGNSGSSAFFDVVDFSDAGAGAVQLRVNAQAATSLELHADSPTGALVGRCAVAATGGAWATQSCALTRTSGVHTLYVLFGGTVRLNWVLFQAGSVATGTGGAGGGGTTGGSGGGPGGATGAGGAGAGGGNGAGGAGGGSSGSGGSGTGGMVLAGSGGSGSGGSGSGIGGASAGSGGSSPPGGGGGSGCACGVGDAGGRSAASAIVALVALLAARRRRRDV